MNKYMCLSLSVALSVSAIRSDPDATAGVPSAGTTTEHAAPRVGLWAARQGYGGAVHQTDGQQIREWTLHRSFLTHYLATQQRVNVFGETQV